MHAAEVEKSKMRYYVGENSGRRKTPGGIIHGARYGLDVKPADEDEAIVIDGEIYRIIEDDEDDDEV